MTALDEATRALQRLADETGCERVEICIRADGRVDIRGSDGRGFAMWWVNADLPLDPNIESPLPCPSEAVEMVRRNDARLGAGRRRS